MRDLYQLAGFILQLFYRIHSSKIADIGLPGVHGDVKYIHENYHRIILLRAFFYQAIQNKDHECIKLSSLVTIGAEGDAWLGNCWIPAISKSEILLVCPAGAFIYMDVADGTTTAAKEYFNYCRGQDFFKMALRELREQAGQKKITIAQEYLQDFDTVIGFGENDFQTKKSTRQSMLLFCRCWLVYNLFRDVATNKNKGNPPAMSRELLTVLCYAVHNMASTE